MNISITQTPGMRAGGFSFDAFVPQRTVLPGNLPPASKVKNDKMHLRSRA